MIDYPAGQPHIVFQVGVTGGIGSGKSTVCKIFEAIGIPVYYADDRAKQLMVEDDTIRGQMIKLFGKDAYLQTGGLNRKYIAEIVFEDQEKLKMLNGIVHPAVKKDGQVWHAAQTNVPYTIKEAALMIESGSHQLMDKIVVVTAPEQLRIQRVMARDQVQEKDVIARMIKQMHESERLSYADYVVLNDGSRSIVRQVWAIHQSLISENTAFNQYSH